MYSLGMLVWSSGIYRLQSKFENHHYHSLPSYCLRCFFNKCSWYFMVFVLAAHGWPGLSHLCVELFGLLEFLQCRLSDS